MAIFKRVVLLAVYFFSHAALHCQDPSPLLELCKKALAKNLLCVIDPEKSYGENLEIIKEICKFLPRDIKHYIQAEMCSYAVTATFPRLKIYSHDNALTSLLFHPQKNILYSSSLDEKIKSFDINNRFIDKYLSGPNDAYDDSIYPLGATKTLATCYAADGTFITGTHTGFIGIRKPGKNFEYIMVTPKHKITHICSNANAQEIAVSTQHRLRVLRPADKQCTLVKKFKTPITAIAFLPEKNIVAAGLASGEIILYENSNKLAEVIAKPDKIIYLAFHGEQLFSVDTTGLITWWAFDPLFQTYIEHEQLECGQPMTSFATTGDQHAYALDNNICINHDFLASEDKTASFHHPISHVTLNKDNAFIASADTQGNVFLAPTPESLSSKQAIFLMLINELHGMPIPDNALLKELKSKLKTNDFGKNNFNETFYHLLKNQLKKLSWKRKKNFIAAKTKIIKNLLKKEPYSISQE